MYHEDDRGPQEWSGVHGTHRTTVAQLVDVDNVGPQGTLLAGFEMFRNAGENLDAVIQKARATAGACWRSARAGRCRRSTSPTAGW